MNVQNGGTYAAKVKKPFYKKWWFWLIVAVVVIAAAVGGSGNGEGNGTASSTSDAAPSKGTSAKDADDTAGKPATDSSQAYNSHENDKQGSNYEVTYADAKIWTNSLGTRYAHVAAVITNTGTTDLYIESGSFDLEDENGKIVATCSLALTYPEVIAPSEKAYICQDEALDEYQGEGALKVILRPDIERARVERIRYDVSELQISAGFSSDVVKIIGRVTNTSSTVTDDINVAVFLFDKDKNIIGVCVDYIYDPVQVNDKIGFEVTEILPDYLTFEDVDSYEVVAYSNQFQW